MRINPNFSLLILGLSLISSTFYAGAETGQPPDPIAALRGAPIYQQFCQSCHGKNGVGEPPPPTSIKLPGYNHAPALDDSEHAWHHSDENLLQMIMEGNPRFTRMMPWNGILTKQQAKDIIAYFKSLWGSRALECQGPKHMACMKHAPR